MNKYMNGLFKYFIICTSLLLFSKVSFPQQLPMPTISVQATYTGKYKPPVPTPRPTYNSYPTSGYGFQLKVHIIFQGNATLIDSLYGIVYILPDGSYEKLVIRDADVFPYSPQIFDYSLSIVIKKAGVVQIFIAQSSDFSQHTDVHFYQNTSNRASIFLNPN